jgi:hypothetical protein
MKKRISISLFAITIALLLHFNPNVVINKHNFSIQLGPAIAQAPIEKETKITRPLIQDSNGNYYCGCTGYSLCTAACL